MAIRETADAAAPGVLQVRARGARPATAAHLATDVVVAPLHALDRDEGLAVTRGDDAWDAVVVGRDDSLDLALVRATGIGAPSLPIAETDAGAAELVVAVARSWHGDLVARLASITGSTCPQRRWRAEPVPTLLRTDLAPGRGISGGALVGGDGRVQGWLTTGLARGAVLAVPPSVLSDRITRLLQHGRIRRGYVGMAVQPVLLPPSQQAHGTQAVLISGLDGAGPGATAGLFVGDVVLAVDGVALADPGGLQGVLTESRIGTALSLRVLRGTTVHEIAVTIGERAR